MKTKKLANVAAAVCVACGACVRVCPRQALTVWKGCYAKADPSLCVGCGICVKTCPAGCITVEERGQES